AAPESAALPAPVRGRTFVILGFCRQELGQVDAARRDFDEAIALDPGDDAALVARGVLRRTSDPAGAAQDFRRAVALHTSLLNPYLSLAADALDRGDYNQLVELAEEA